LFTYTSHGFIPQSRSSDLCSDNRSSIIIRALLSLTDATSNFIILDLASPFFSSPYPKEESSIQERTLCVFSPNLKKLVHGRHSSFYAYMNIDLATQAVIGHNFFLSSAWTGDDGPPRKYLVRHHPSCPQAEGVIHCPRSDFSHHPLSSTDRGGPLSEIGCSSSPPRPQLRGVVHCPRSDFSHHPPVHNREGWSIVRDRTFHITPLSSTERGGPLSEIGRSSSPPCPQPRGVVHCPRSDVPHHPPVLNREGWSIVRDRTVLITPLSST
jgi:hypothetical protein